jgi:hypothetical protein
MGLTNGLHPDQTKFNNKKQFRLSAKKKKKRKRKKKKKKKKKRKHIHGVQFIQPTNGYILVKRGHTVLGPDGGRLVVPRRDQLHLALTVAVHHSRFGTFPPQTAVGDGQRNGHELRNRPVIHTHTYTNAFPT